MAAANLPGGAMMANMLNLSDIGAEYLTLLCKGEKDGSESSPR
jgi:hypothetical protein